MVAFNEKMRGEESSLRHFLTQKFNNEGDAFKHYIWAGLLTKELGSRVVLLRVGASNSKSNITAHLQNRSSIFVYIQGTNIILFSMFL